MTASSAFDRIVLVHTGEHPETDLLEYTALLTATTSGGKAVVAVYPSDGVLGTLTPAVRNLFRNRSLRPPAIRMLSEPDVDGVLEAAQEHRADLLVVRHPRFFEESRTLARIILSEAPCSVCFVPEGVEPRIRRLIVNLAADDTDSALLAHAVQLYNGAGAAELVAVHSRFNEANGYGKVLRERFSLESSLRLSTTHDLHAATHSMNEETTGRRLKLAGPVLECEPDFVVVGRKAGGSARVSGQLLRDCPYPLMQVLLPERPPGWKRALKRALSNDHH